MAELALLKTPAGFVPATDQDAESIQRIKTGSVIRADFKKIRNPRYHRKFFALLNLAFDSWEPPEQEHKGMPVQKNFERFRKDLVIAAGFYDAVANINGEVRAEAHSISFAKMGEVEFNQVYSKVCDVVLQRILTRYKDQEELDRVINQILGFL